MRLRFFPLALYLMACVGFQTYSVHALTINSGLDTARGNAGFSTDSIEATIGNLIYGLLTFLGVIFLVLVIYAGALWMTAAGEKDKVQKAKEILIRAAIGLLLTLSAYAITDFVVKTLNGENAGSSGGSSDDVSSPCGSDGSKCA